MQYLEAWTLIHEKNLKSKISCQTPFKEVNKEKHYLYDNLKSKISLHLWVELSHEFKMGHLIRKSSIIVGMV